MIILYLVSILTALLVSLVLHVTILRFLSRKTGVNTKKNMREQKGGMVFKREFTETRVSYEYNYFSGDGL
ncbi:MAG: hypothetical protein IJL03_04470 [Lachnospiraceae bacterium]|nr:hypothetical protein [Lachnospiraceae bacterium]